MQLHLFLSNIGFIQFFSTPWRRHTWRVGCISTNFCPRHQIWIILTELEAGCSSEPVWTFWRRTILPLYGFEPRIVPPV